MIINTDAIVLKTFSYGETSLISRCFTKDKGKISFIIKGAKSKKNLVSPYFQPLSFINIIYKENEKRELQIVSKVSFVQIWTQISLSLRKMSLSQSILEISDFTLEKNDPYPDLFSILIKTFQSKPFLYISTTIVFKVFNNFIICLWCYKLQSFKKFFVKCI